MRMRRCCFLTMDSLAGYVSDDELAVEPLRELGWNVSFVSWRAADVDWNSYKAVIIRTPWDYQDDPDRFLQTLKRIDASSACLENPLPLVEWNLNKRYLRNLEDKGIRIVPTCWGRGTFTRERFSEWKIELCSDELIIKPAISATAQDTYRVADYDPYIAEKFADRDYLAQPFVQAIVDEGEYSLFYFNSEYSHTILKSPQRGDFRVQEEHGGIISSVKAEPEMLETAMQINSALGTVPLYSRIDLVRLGDGFSLMELELIEPALYFRMDPGSPRRFAEALNARMNEL